MNKELRYLVVENLETRATDTGAKIIKGYAVKWNTRSSALIYGEFYEQVAKGAFSKSIAESNIVALWNHDTNLVLGATRSGTMKLLEDDIGLAFEITLPNNTWGNDAYESISRGDVSGVSFGFWCRKDSVEYLRDEDVYIRTLLDVNIFEISPTAFPAYDTSEVSKRSLEFLPDTKEERALKRQKEQEIEQLKKRLELELDLM